MNGVTQTWGELDHRSTRAAHSLLNSGLHPGDRIAVLERSDPSFFELMFACSKAGLVLVSLNWRLAPAELERIANDAEPSMLFVGEEYLDRLPAGLVAAERIIVSGTHYEEFVERGDDVEIDHEAHPDAVVLQLYSSGTTGMPKGVMLTNRNIGYTARMGAGAWAASSESVNLIHSPLFHVGGAVYAMTTMGQGGHTILVPDAKVPTILEAVQKYGVTHSWFVPTLIRDLLDVCESGGGDLSGMNIVGYGGAPIEASLVKRALRLWNCGFLGVYGTTETASTLTALLPEDHNSNDSTVELLESVGRPLPWVELSIVDPDTSKPLETGAVGEVWVRSGQNMKGYWKQPGETARALTSDGWLKTGDAGYQDGNGYVFLKDRIKDVIMSGGENIYPAEVEAVLNSHPEITEAAVVGVPHDRWGETVRAVVVLSEGSHIDGDGVIDFCRDRLAHYKCPTIVDVVDVLPHNASGKLLRRELRTSKDAAFQ
jgi:long-chain acyl-CoA synthetase